MNIRGKILLVVALVAGTFCALVTKAILNSIPETEEEAALVEEKTIPTMVAKRDLLPGDEITPQNIRFDRLPESQVPAEAISYYSDAKHRTLVKGVGKGQLVSLYDLNESDSAETGYYTPLNSSCASFLIGSVIGSSGKSEEFFDDLKRNIVPGTDKVDFYVTSEKREEDSADGAKPVQRTSVVKKILDDIDIYQVRVIQQPTDFGTTEPRLELSFILNDEQIEMLEEAEGAGRVTIEFAVSEEDETQGRSPLFDIEPAVIPAGTAPEEPAEPVAEEELPPPEEETAAPVQPASDSSPMPAQTAEIESAEPPRMSVPRPRMSVPRPDAAM